MQMLLSIICLGVLAFGSTLFYYHSVLGVDRLDLGSLSLADHPLIKNELGQMQKAFKELAPGFNEFTHFTDQTLSVFGSAAAAGGGGGGGGGGYNTHANQPSKKGPPLEHHEMHAARSAPEDIAAHVKFGTGPQAQLWAEQDMGRLARMAT